MQLLEDLFGAPLDTDELELVVANVESDRELVEALVTLEFDFDCELIVWIVA